MSAGKRTSSASLEPGGSSPRECPLCAEELDETDLALLPCPCDYQVCIWCLQRIRERENNKCPQCRRDYDESLYRKVKVQTTSRSRTSESGTENSHRRGADAAGFRTDSQRSSFCEDELSAGVPNQSTSSSAAPRHFLNYKQTAICRLVNCPSSVMSAQVLSSFRYFGKYGKLASVAICNTKGVDYVFLIYSMGENAMYAIQDFNKYLSNGRDNIWKHSKLVLGAAKHCIQSLRGVKCATDNCPFTHCTTNQSPKYFWKYLRKNPGELNIVRQHFPESFIQESVGDLSKDSFFDRTISDLAAAYPHLNIPPSVISAAMMAAATGISRSSPPIKSRTDHTASDASSVEMAPAEPARVVRGWRKPTPAVLHPKTSDTDNAIFPAIETSVSLVMQETAAAAAQSYNSSKKFNAVDAHSSNINPNPNTPPSPSEDHMLSCQSNLITKDRQSETEDQSVKSTPVVNPTAPHPIVSSNNDQLRHQTTVNPTGTASSRSQTPPLHSHPPTTTVHKKEGASHSASMAPTNAMAPPTLTVVPSQAKTRGLSAVGMKVYLPPKNFTITKPASAEPSPPETEDEEEAFEIPSNDCSKIRNISESVQSDSMHINEELTKESYEHFGNEPSQRALNVRNTDEWALYEKARKMVLGGGGFRAAQSSNPVSVEQAHLDDTRQSRSAAEATPCLNNSLPVLQPQMRLPTEIRRNQYDGAKPWRNASFTAQAPNISGAIYNSFGTGAVSGYQPSVGSIDSNYMGPHESLPQAPAYYNGRYPCKPPTLRAGGSGMCGPAGMSFMNFLDGRGLSQSTVAADRPEYVTHSSLNPSGQVRSSNGLVTTSGDRFWMPSTSDADIFFSDDRYGDQQVHQMECTSEMAVDNSHNRGQTGSAWLSSLLRRFDGSKYIYKDDNSLVPSTASAEFMPTSEENDDSMGFRPAATSSRTQHPSNESIANGKLDSQYCSASGDAAAGGHSHSANQSQVNMDILRSVVPNATINIASKANRFMT